MHCHASLYLMTPPNKSNELASFYKLDVSSAPYLLPSNLHNEHMSSSSRDSELILLAGSCSVVAAALLCVLVSAWSKSKKRRMLTINCRSNGSGDGEMTVRRYVIFGMEDKLIIKKLSEEDGSASLSVTKHGIEANADGEYISPADPATLSVATSSVSSSSESAASSNYTKEHEISEDMELYIQQIEETAATSSGSFSSTSSSGTSSTET
jgi:hypothetical protein